MTVYDFHHALHICMFVFNAKSLHGRTFSLRNPETRNNVSPDNNLEHRPITIIELDLNAMTLCDGESLPVSS